MSLNQARLQELLSYDPKTGSFTWRVSRNGTLGIGTNAGHLDGGYVRIRVDRVLYRAHRLAWLYANGEEPAGQIDHINGDKADNRLCNLRVVTNAQNQQNVRAPRSNNKLGVLGVMKTASGRFSAHIWVDGGQRSIGTHATIEGAHMAYIAAKKLSHEGYVS